MIRTFDTAAGHLARLYCPPLPRGPAAPLKHRARGATLRHPISRITLFALQRQLSGRQFQDVRIAASLHQTQAAPAPQSAPDHLVRNAGECRAPQRARPECSLVRHRVPVVGCCPPVSCLKDTPGGFTRFAAFTVEVGAAHVIATLPTHQLAASAMQRCRAVGAHRTQVLAVASMQQSCRDGMRKQARSPDQAMDEWSA